MTNGLPQAPHQLDIRQAQVGGGGDGHQALRFGGGRPADPLDASGWRASAAVARTLGAGSRQCALANGRSCSIESMPQPQLVACAAQRSFMRRDYEGLERRFAVARSTLGDLPDGSSPYLLEASLYYESAWAARGHGYAKDVRAGDRSGGVPRRAVPLIDARARRSDFKSARGPNSAGRQSPLDGIGVRCRRSSPAQVGTLEFASTPRKSTSGRLLLNRSVRNPAVPRNARITVARSRPSTGKNGPEQNFVALQSRRSTSGR